MCKFFKRFLRSKLRKKHDKALNVVVKTEKEIVNSVFDDYIPENNRKELIEKAKKCCYSEDKTQLLENVFQKYNIDVVTYNIANEIMDAEDHIKQHKRESFLSRISNVIPIDEEEDDE